MVSAFASQQDDPGISVCPHCVAMRLLQVLPLSKSTCYRLIVKSKFTPGVPASVSMSVWCVIACPGSLPHSQIPGIGSGPAASVQTMN